MAERPVGLPPENQGAIGHATAISTTAAAVLKYGVTTFIGPEFEKGQREIRT